jgi:hypothetical protein
MKMTDRGTLTRLAALGPLSGTAGEGEPARGLGG